MQIVKKENFRDYTGDAYEVYQNDVHEAEGILERDRRMFPKQEKKTWRRIILETIWFVGFLTALILMDRFGDVDGAFEILMGMETIAYLLILVNGIIYLREGKKSYQAALRLMKSFDAQRDSLGITEFSQIHAISREILEDREIMPECDGEKEEVLFKQKALYQLIKESGEDGLVLLGYSEEEKVAFLELHTAEGENAVIPVTNCDYVEEEREGIQFSIHPWATILRVPEHTAGTSFWN
jgi:hypothetical protein